MIILKRDLDILSKELEDKIKDYINNIIGCPHCTSEQDRNQAVINMKRLLARKWVEGVNDR